MTSARRLAPFCCAIALLCFGSPAARAQLPGGFTRANVANVPVHTLAERILGWDIAANIESYSLDPPAIYPEGGLTTIRFFGRPRPANAEICVRDEHIVAFLPIEHLSDEAFQRDAPSHIYHFADTTNLALAHGCQMAAGQVFAQIGPAMDAETAIRALAALGAARAAAVGSGALPLHLVCQDELRRDHCSGDGRAALAALPLEKTLIIEGGGPGTIRFDVDGGTTNWALHLAGLGTDHPELTMVSGPPPPF